MGPTWGPSGTDRTQVGPMLALCWPHELCYLGYVAQPCTLHMRTPAPDADVPLTIYFENILSPRVSVYRRGYSCQLIILKLTEYWRRALDDNQNVGTNGMDLSKAFDHMPHGLVLAKFYAYGVAPDACLFITTYLKKSQAKGWNYGHEQWLGHDQ